jgi:hypothetical protein
MNSMRFDAAMEKGSRFAIIETTVPPPYTGALGIDKFIENSS